MQQTTIYPEFRRGEATTGGRSVVVVTGGSTGDVLTLQADGTYLPVTPEAGGGIGGSTGATDNAILRADGTGGDTVQSSLVTIDDTGKLFAPTLRTVSFFDNIDQRQMIFGGGFIQFDRLVYCQGNITKSGTLTVGSSAGGVTISGKLDLAPITKAALLATTPSATAGIYRISDDSNKPAYPDGSAWRYLTDGTLVV